MRDGETPRVQRLPRERAKRGRHRLIGDARPARLTVHRIADDRPASRREMDSYLMHPYRHDPAAQQRDEPRRRDALEVGEAGRADCRGCDDLATVERISMELELD